MILIPWTNKTRRKLYSKDLVPWTKYGLAQGLKKKYLFKLVEKKYKIFFIPRSNKTEIKNVSCSWGSFFHVFNQVNWTLVIWLKSNFKSNKETGNSLGSSDKTVLILRHNVIKKSVTILFIFHFCNPHNCFIAWKNEEIPKPVIFVVLQN